MNNTSNTTAITVNGQQRTLPASSSLEHVVQELTSATTGIAVSINDEVVPRREWTTRAVCSGDRIDVLTAVQGG